MQKDQESSESGAIRTSSWLWLVILISLAWLAIEWLQAPNGTIFLGPLYFAYYGHGIGWVIAAILFPCVFAYPAEPKPITAGVSIVAFAGWLILGFLGKTIGC